MRDYPVLDDSSEPWFVGFAELCRGGGVCEVG